MQKCPDCIYDLEGHGKKVFICKNCRGDTRIVHELSFEKEAPREFQKKPPFRNTKYGRGTRSVFNRR